MNKIFTLILVLFCISGSVLAEKQVICETDPSAITQKFIENWAHSGSTWFFSSAREKMGDLYTIGGIRGPYNNKMPTHRDPQLTFVGPLIQNGRDEGETQIDCQYAMANQEVCDINCPASGRNLLYMRTVVYVDKNACRYVDDNKVICN